MGDREARALGIGSVVKVEGTEYTLSPISIGVLEEMQRAALKSYKAEYLETYRDNKEFLPDGMFEKTLKEVAGWSIADLPMQVGYDVSNIEINDSIEQLLFDHFPEEKDREFDSIAERILHFQSLLVTALDGKKISSEQIKEVSGKRPLSGKVSYDMWWATATWSGMILLVKSSLQKKHPKVTLDDVRQWGMGDLIRSARLAEQLTAPVMGNT